ncbi:MAG: 50S ribosomal protein L15 [Planctomycetota bacterium]|jgi:large subunit ribosomal protein L15
MKLDAILSSAGKYKARKRVGRGIGSGCGKTCGRGHKGAGARAGYSRRLGFEGGQNPVLARLPKRGFSNAKFRKEFQIVNVAALDGFDKGARVDAEALAAAGLIDDPTKPIKILGNGELKKKLTVAASKFSASAVEKITQAGGSVEQV